MNYMDSIAGSARSVGNVDIKDTVSYAGASRKAWHGRALVVVRSTHKGGKITVTVSSKGIRTAMVLLNSR